MDEFERFVRLRGPSLLRSACLLTGDQQLAEDLVQAALARCHRHWRSLRDTGNAEAYTRKIMYHLQVAWWRRRRRSAEVLVAEVPERTSGEDHASTTSTRSALQLALLRLTPAQRAVIVLRFYEDRGTAETAELLGVSEGTVKSQTAKALARLRTLMPAIDPEGARG